VCRPRKTTSTEPKLLENHVRVATPGKDTPESLASVLGPCELRTCSCARIPSPTAKCTSAIFQCAQGHGPRSEGPRRQKWSPFATFFKGGLAGPPRGVLPRAASGSTAHSWAFTPGVTPRERSCSIACAENLAAPFTTHIITVLPDHDRELALRKRGGVVRANATIHYGALRLPIRSGQFPQTRPAAHCDGHPFGFERIVDQTFAIYRDAILRLRRP